jgi:hypothetical protein
MAPDSCDRGTPMAKLLFLAAKLVAAAISAALVTGIRHRNVLSTLGSMERPG